MKRDRSHSPVQSRALNKGAAKARPADAAGTAGTAGAGGREGDAAAAAAAKEAKDIRDAKAAWEKEKKEKIKEQKEKKVTADATSMYDKAMARKLAKEKKDRWVVGKYYKY